MKQLLIYYFSVFLPIPLLLWSAKNDSILFICLLISYYIYRKIIDAKRLIDKKLIKQKDIWKIILIPFYSSYFFKELFFDA